VIVGRLVPAGTGYRDFSRIKMVTEERPVVTEETV
jgi:hypothetical protein